MRKQTIRPFVQTDHLYNSTNTPRRGPFCALGQQICTPFICTKCGHQPLKSLKVKKNWGPLFWLSLTSQNFPATPKLMSRWKVSKKHTMGVMNPACCGDTCSYTPICQSCCFHLYVEPHHILIALFGNTILLLFGCLASVQSLTHLTSESYTSVQ